MTRDEMQRFLDLPEIVEIGELEALRRLTQVIGIQYHGETEQKSSEKPKDK